MSEVLWCDPGDHLFSANDTERKVMTEPLSYDDQQKGMKATRLDVCGDHKAKGFAEDRVRKLMKPRPAELTPAEIASVKGYDPEYVKWLESQNGE